MSDDTITLDPTPETKDEFEELRRNVETFHSEDYSNDEIFTQLMIAGAYRFLTDTLADETDDELRYYQ